MLALGFQNGLIIHKKMVVDCDQTRPDQTRPENFHCIAFKMKLLSYLPLTVMCQLCIFENAMYFVPGEFLSECHSSSRWIKGVHSSREYILRTRAYLYRNADKNQKSWKMKMKVVATWGKRRQCHHHTICFFISDLTNLTIRYYCETSRLV